MGKPAGTVEYRVVEAGYDEMDAILDLSERFFVESNYADHLTFDRIKLRSNLFCAWQNRPRDFITFVLMTDEREPAGFAHVRREDVFTVECVGELYQFYILPNHRGRGAARMLRDACQVRFDAWGCRISYVECGSGLDAGKNDKLFFNLWGKIGYKFLGTALFKRG